MKTSSRFKCNSPRVSPMPDSPKSAPPLSACDKEQPLSNVLRYKSIFHQIAVGIVCASPDGILRDVNSNLCRMLGHTEEELVGHSITEFIHPDDRASAHSAIASLVSGEHRDVSPQIRFCRKDGRVLWTQTAGSPVLDRQGKLEFLVGVIQDISTRIELERTIKINEERYRSLTQAITSVIWTSNADGYFTEPQKSWEKYTGQSWEEYQGLGWFNAIHPDDRAQAKATWYQAWQTRSIFRVEGRLKHSSGKYRYFEARGMPLFHDDGSVREWIGTCVDVHDRRVAEMALRDSEEHLRLAIDAGRIGTWDWDIDHNRVTWSEQMYEFHGIPPGGFDGTIETFLDMVHPDDRARIQRKIQRSLQTLAPYSAEMRTLHADGRIGWLSANGRVIAGTDGKAIRMLGATVNITPNKNFENALRESEARFRHMADTAPAIIWMTDSDAICTFLSHGWYELTRQSGRVSLNEGWEQAIHPDDRQILPAFREAHLSQLPIKLEYRLRRHDGQYRWVINHARPRLSESGEFLGFIGSLVDITERKEAEQALLEANSTLEQRVEERTRQLEQFTVQLRRLANELTNTEQRERRRLAEILHDHVQQLLIAAKIQFEVLDKSSLPEKAKHNLVRGRELIAEAVDAARSLAAELRPPVLYESGLGPALKMLSENMRKQHDLNVIFSSISETLPLPDQSRTLLYHSVRELLFNIVKHAKVKECHLDVRQENGDIVITVTDEGCGFDINVIGTGGSGFGLFSIRERIKLLSGSMEVTSEPNKGTTTRIRLPLVEDKVAQRLVDEVDAAPAPARTVPRASVRDGKQPKSFITVLLVDDHTVVRQGIATILKSYPEIHVIDEASDGEEAVRKALELRPDVVIMDVNMPRMNGIEAARIIHQNNPGTEIIGLSVQDEPAIIEDFKAAGARAYFNKAEPVEKMIELLLN